MRADNFVPAWPAFLATESLSLASLTAALEQSQYWPSAGIGIGIGQQAQLTQIFEWAVRKAPYYKDSRRMSKSLTALTRSGGSFWDVWREIPILSKATLRGQSARMHAPKIPQSHLPLATSITSGSTGIVVEVHTTALTRLLWDALTLREHLWHRRDFSKRFGATRFVPKAKRELDGSSAPNWGSPVSQLYRSGPGSFIHVGYTVDVLAEWLRRFDPHYLITYPSVAAALMDEMRAKPASLEEIRFISEPLPPALETRLREEWGVSVSDIYSANEVGVIAFRCGEYGNLHIQQETILAEILNETGTPCAAGETGRVVVTPLHNLATPLIRYEIGDYATAGEPCPCGRPSPVIRQVKGRVRNLARAPDGRSYWPVAIGKFKAIQAVRQFQYVQSASDTIQLRLVLNCPLSKADEEHVVELVREALGYPFRVEILPVASIERGPTGKFEEFLSLLPPV